ncbi:hypothetical protein [Novosphingobium huizhouense]|uniref:hypothetical protein n=1 Tax=Novosphingobium huizhouense TaxID=2866625 RepID=UPI0021E5C5AF|nr:hypothetical protein [Novosphingobium huizhouense]
MTELRDFEWRIAPTRAAAPIPCATPAPGSASPAPVPVPVPAPAPALLADPHREPPAAHLFGAGPHGPAAARPAIPLAERDHFAERFAIDFAAALDRRG